MELAAPQDKQCIVLPKGRNLLGKCVVWRSPCKLASDIEVWEAVAWPPEWGPAPDNFLVCTSQGYGIAALAGGDCDSDDVAVAFDPDSWASKWITQFRKEYSPKGKPFRNNCPSIYCLWVRTFLPLQIFLKIRISFFQETDMGA